MIWVLSTFTLVVTTSVHEFSWNSYYQPNYDIVDGYVPKNANLLSFSIMNFQFSSKPVKIREIMIVDVFKLNQIQL